MPTALESAIDSLSNPSVALPDALRQLLVVSRRIGAAELTTWLRGELGGYDSGIDVPQYRDGKGLPIKLRFDGPMGSSATRHLSPAELPNQLARVAESNGFREPVAELQALASGNGDPEMQLPVAWLAMYRQLIEQGKVPSIEYMVLNHASIAMPRTHLVGILDRVKSTALDLALSLEDVSPEVGDTGGPTVVSEPRLAEQIHIHLGSVYATNSTVTVGDNATVATGKKSTAISVEPGDITGLLVAAAKLLNSDGVAALAEALNDDGDRPGTSTRGFLDRVKAGAGVLAVDMTTNAAYDGLVALLQQAFPGALS